MCIAAVIQQEITGVAASPLHEIQVYNCLIIPKNQIIRCVVLYPREFWSFLCFIDVIARHLLCTLRRVLITICSTSGGWKTGALRCRWSIKLYKLLLPADVTQISKYSSSQYPSYVTVAIQQSHCSTVLVTENMTNRNILRNSLSRVVSYICMQLVLVLYLQLISLHTLHN